MWISKNTVMAVKEEILDGIKYRYVKRKNMRRIRLSVAADRTVRVSMPYYVTFAEAKKFALSKLSWIRAKLADSSACSPTVLRGGEGFVYFGRSYPLAIEEGTKYKFEFRDSVAVLKEPKDGNTDKRTAFMRKWFAKELEKRIEERLPYWESVCGMRAEKVSVRFTTSKWGSCTYDNRISVSGFIAEKPPECLDYLLVHELVHTVVKNHGKAFYEALERYYPDWKRARKILKS